MTHQPEDGVVEEIILPENLLPLGSVLGQGVTPLDISMVLAKVFKVQHAEVALLRLERRPASSLFFRSICGPPERFRFPARRWLPIRR